MKLSEVDQCALNLMIISSFGTCSCNYNYIYSTPEMFFRQSVTFSYQSGQMMSDNTVSDFFTYRYPYSVFLKSIF